MVTLSDVKPPAETAEFFLGPMFSSEKNDPGRPQDQASPPRRAQQRLREICRRRPLRRGPRHLHSRGSSVAASLSGVGLGRLRDVEALNLWMLKGCRVAVAALDGDFRRIPSPVAKAFPFASRIVKVTAICMLCARRERVSGGSTRPARLFFSGSAGRRFEGPL